jgi:hypothetical protein
MEVQWSVFNVPAVLPPGKRVPGAHLYLTLPFRFRKPRLTPVGFRCADHATPSTRKGCALISPTSGGRSVDIVRLRTTATEFFFF